MEFFSDLLWMSAGSSPAMSLDQSMRIRNLRADLGSGFHQGSLLWETCLSRGRFLLGFPTWRSSGYLCNRERFDQFGTQNFLRGFSISWFPWSVDVREKDSGGSLFLSDIRSRAKPHNSQLLQSPCFGCASSVRRVDKIFVMASSIGGGDKGTFAKKVARPKPTDGDMADNLESALVIAPSSGGVLQSGGDLNRLPTSHGEHSNPLKQASASDDARQGPRAFTAGEDLEEEDDVIEVNIEEDEMKQAAQWTTLARFYSMRIPNQTALFDGMSRAWRLRADMNYKSLRDNLFIISFKSEGDYKFVLQGGPWLHKGDALLVAEFDGLTPPLRFLWRWFPSGSEFMIYP